MKKLLLMLAAIFLIGFGAQAEKVEETSGDVKEGGSVLYKWIYWNDLKDDYKVWPNWKIIFASPSTITPTGQNVTLKYILKKKDSNENPVFEGDANFSGANVSNGEQEITFYSGALEPLGDGTFTVECTFTYTPDDATEPKITKFTTEFKSTAKPEADYVFALNPEPKQEGTSLKIRYDITEVNGKEIPADASYFVRFGIQGWANQDFSTKSGEATFNGLKLGEEYQIWVQESKITIPGKVVEYEDFKNFWFTMKAAPVEVKITDATTTPQTKNSGELAYKFTVTGKDGATVPEGMTYKVWVVNDKNEAVSEVVTTTKTEGTIDLFDLKEYSVTKLTLKVEGMTADGLPTNTAEKNDIEIDLGDMKPLPTLALRYRVEGTVTGANIYYRVLFEDFIDYTADDLKNAKFKIEVKDKDGKVIAQSEAFKTDDYEKLFVKFDGESTDVTIEASATVAGDTYTIKEISTTLTKSPFKVNIAIPADGLSFEGSRDSGVITYSVDLTGTTDDITTIYVMAVNEGKIVGETTLTKEAIEDGVLSGKLEIKGLKKEADNNVTFNVEVSGPKGTNKFTSAKTIVCKPAPAFEVRLGITKADFVQNDENPEGYIDYEVMVDVIYGEVKSFKVWAAWPDHEDADMMEITDFTLNNGKLTGKLPLSEIAIDTEKTVWFKVQAFGEIPAEDYSSIPEKAVVFTPKMVMEFVTEPTFTAINSTEGYINYSVKFINSVNKLSMLKIWVASPESEYGDMETYENVELPTDPEDPEYHIFSGKMFLTDLAPNASTERVFKMQAFAAGGYETDILEKTVVCTTTSTGIDGIDADGNAEAVYYNLQGVRVANPEHGTYIMVKGGKATKVVL